MSGSDEALAAAHRGTDHAEARDHQRPASGFRHCAIDVEHEPTVGIEAAEVDPNAVGGERDPRSVEAGIVGGAVDRHRSECAGGVVGVEQSETVERGGRPIAPGPTEHADDELPVIRRDIGNPKIADGRTAADRVSTGPKSVVPTVGNSWLSWMVWPASNAADAGVATAMVANTAIVMALKRLMNLPLLQWKR